MWRVIQQIFTESFELARYLGTIVLGFALLKTILFVIKEQFRLSKLRGINDHIVICGLGQKGYRLANQFLEMKAKVVIIELNRNNEYYEELVRKGAIIIKESNAADIYILKKAKVEKSKYCIIITGNDEINIEIVSLLYKINLQKELKCFVHIYNHNLHKLFSDHVYFNEEGYLKARLFNLYEKSSRELFNLFPPDRFRRITSNEDPPVHILIVGFGKLGTSLLVQAGRIGHYAYGKKIKVTIIDNEPSVGELSLLSKYRNFKLSYPLIENVVDIKLENYSAEILNNETINNINKENTITAFYICVNDDSMGFMLGSMISRAMNNSKIPIVVCLEPKTKLSNLFSEMDLKYNIYSIIDSVCNINSIINDEDKIDLMAKTIHDFYCQNENKKNGVNNNSDVLNKWNKLNRKYREANRKSAEHIFVKLRALGYDTVGSEEIKKIEISNESLLRIAKMEKNRWNAEKWLDDWYYGEIRNDQLKITSKLIPWEDLNADDKQKDVNNVIIIPELVNMSNVKLYKIDN